MACRMVARVLVTAALPYANGDIHLGHMLEAIQTDVYVRARKLSGEACSFMWASDTHGTPIQVRARKEGITPEALVARAHVEHEKDYRAFGIGFDIFYTTHSEESRKHVETMFNRMNDAGDIEVRAVDQLYCEHDGMFLPDRFVRGTCPKCGAADQYGDNCEVCGTTYAPTDLRDPACAVCGRLPALRSSQHVFVSLNKHAAFLRQWLNQGGVDGSSPLMPAVRNYVQEWVEGGLRDWDISRDGPYFGFEIPGFPGKYFYVWFDAPVGYVAATDKWCQEHHEKLSTFWGIEGERAEIVHVIGKDIVYFHALFWPTVLHASGYNTPSRIQVHGWLTVNGERMSKSRGTFILARTFLEHFPPDALRYYFAAKLSARQEDIDLNLEDFVVRTNADLVKKAANLASRCVKFIESRLGGTLGALPGDASALVERAQVRVAEAAAHYRSFDSSRALKLAMEIADDFNLFVTEKAPWKQTDTDAARATCSAGVFATQCMATILKPVLPAWAEKVERFLCLPTPLSFVGVPQPLPAGHRVGPYETLAEPLQLARVEALVAAGKTEPSAAVFAYDVPVLASECTIDAFTAIDLRVGHVLACERVEGADKLLRLRISLGPLGEREILSGIAKSYAPEDLVGKNVAVFANLRPRKMRFGVSQGMVLAAGETDDAIVVTELAAHARAGDPVR